MRTFVLWRAADPTACALTPVAERLAAMFAPLLTPEVTVASRSLGPVRLAWLELPVKGFRAPFFEELGPRWALAPDYPLNARRLLRAHGMVPAAGQALLTLGRELERRAAAYVGELTPPAALLWSNPEAGEVRVQNDGLGQAQLFEYEHGGLWALTNRVMALRALGIELRPVADEWAARFVTNWFPLDRTGYEDLRFLAGGTQLRIGAGGVRRALFDPVDEWVAPAPRTRADALELGRHGLLNTLTDALELCERPTVGLSGGWDSRCVTSCLRELGADFDVRVRGQETHFDVILSAELARIAGLPHRIKSEGGIPPDSAEGCRASIARALLWQGGYYATKKHKNFLAKKGKDALDGGVVNVMGQHAGVGKADFVTKTEALSNGHEGHEERLLRALLADAPPFLRGERMDGVHELLRNSYRAAGERGLTQLGPLLYFYLNEFTRRWGSATVASQTGLVLAPFLCPDVIRACYLLPPEELPSKPLHRYVTALHAPDWAGVPYTDEVTEEDFQSGRLPRIERAQPEPTDEHAPRWRSVRHHKKFHYKFYWTDVAQPLLQEAFRKGGFWTEVFDADAARRTWADSVDSADALAIAHILPEVLDGSLPTPEVIVPG
jgi:hypothetical protein